MPGLVRRRSRSEIHRKECKIGEDYEEIFVFVFGAGNADCLWAECLAQVEELPCDVIFAAFNTEDNQQSGSAVLAEHMEEQYQQIRNRGR